MVDKYEDIENDIQYFKNAFFNSKVESFSDVNQQAKKLKKKNSIKIPKDWPDNAQKAVMLITTSIAQGVGDEINNIVDSVNNEFESQHSLLESTLDSSKKLLEKELKGQRDIFDESLTISKDFAEKSNELLLRISSDTVNFSTVKPDDDTSSIQSTGIPTKENSSVTDKKVTAEKILGSETVESNVYTSKPEDEKSNVDSFELLQKENSGVNNKKVIAEKIIGREIQPDSKTTVKEKKKRDEEEEDKNNKNKKGRETTFRKLKKLLSGFSGSASGTTSFLQGAFVATTVIAPLLLGAYNQIRKEFGKDFEDWSSKWVVKKFPFFASDDQLKSVIENAKSTDEEVALAKSLLNKSFIEKVKELIQRFFGGKSKDSDSKESQSSSGKIQSYLSDRTVTAITDPKKALSDSVGDLKNAVSGSVDGLKNAPKHANTYLDEVNKHYQGKTDPASKTVSYYTDRVKTIRDDPLQALKDSAGDIKKTISNTSDFFGESYDKIKDVASDPVGKFKSRISSIYDNPLQTTSQAFTDVFGPKTVTGKQEQIEDKSKPIVRKEKNGSQENESANPPKVVSSISPIEIPTIPTFANSSALQLFNAGVLV